MVSLSVEEHVFVFYLHIQLLKNVKMHILFYFRIEKVNIFLPPGIRNFVQKCSIHKADWSGEKLMCSGQSFSSISFATRWTTLQVALWLIPIRKSLPTVC